VAIEVDLAPDLVVGCGAGILTSIVSNLVRNAVKYVGDGAGRRVTVRARPGGLLVRLEVEDDGPGLPPSLGANVFQPYVRGPSTGKPGIGLGLATVKKVTEAHGGRIEVRSAPGQGCRFEVDLPVALPALSLASDAKKPGDAAARQQEDVDQPPQAP
jgi:signal transduction histidine kinase